MSTSVIEPGTRLAGRYRLEDRVSEAGGSTLWKAIDEILARAVAVRTFAPGFPRVDAVVTGARAASRLTDPRLTQVFDADDSTEHAYVVSEWVSGETLADLLTLGPMETDRAVSLIAEVAEAVAAAHVSGLAHLCLTPRNLLWTGDGRVKVTGLGVEAALGGISSDNPALTDTRGLGRMLYAALTAHWPGPDGETALPAAPLFDGQLCAPRQVRAGVSNVLDSITCRALGVHARKGQEPLTTPAEVAEAIAYVPRAPLPLYTAPIGAPPSVVHRESLPVDGTDLGRPSHHHEPAGPPAGRGRHGGSRHNDRQDGPPPVNRALVVLSAVLILIVLGVGGWQLSRFSTDKPPVAAGSKPPGDAAGNALQPAGATGFDPQARDHVDDENNAKAPLAIDGNPATKWTTEGYLTAKQGGFKSGVGLLIDMGKTVKVSNIKVTLPGPAGSTLELRLGDAKSLDQLKLVASDSNATGTIELTPRQPTECRYVLLWFTKLAQDGNRFRGQISDVVVNGAS